MYLTARAGDELHLELHEPRQEPPAEAMAAAGGRGQWAAAAAAVPTGERQRLLELTLVRACGVHAARAAHSRAPRSRPRLRLTRSLLAPPMPRLSQWPPLARPACPPAQLVAGTTPLFGAAAWQRATGRTAAVRSTRPRGPSARSAGGAAASAGERMPGHTPAAASVAAAAAAAPSGGSADWLDRQLARLLGGEAEPEAAPISPAAAASRAPLEKGESSSVRLSSWISGSGPCMVNERCDVGRRWEAQAAGVAAIVEHHTASICTGTLINSLGSGKPRQLFLTAYHCVRSRVEDGAFDVSDNFLPWSFLFNWQSDSCAGNDVPSSRAHAGGIDSVYGATIRAYGNDTDFALLEIHEQIPAQFSVYYAGWDATGVRPNMSLIIHHPTSDLKKITLDYDAPKTWSFGGDDYYQIIFGERRVWTSPHWFIERYEVGSTEGGSSGGPLFNWEGRLIGVLHGGYADCQLPKQDWYGKLVNQWDEDARWFQHGLHGALSRWLDPSGSGVRITDGEWLRPHAHTPRALAGVELGAQVRARARRTGGLAPGRQLAVGEGTHVTHRVPTPLPVPCLSPPPPPLPSLAAVCAPAPAFASPARPQSLAFAPAGSGQLSSGRALSVSLLSPPSVALSLTATIVGAAGTSGKAEEAATAEARRCFRVEPSQLRFEPAAWEEVQWLSLEWLRDGVAAGDGKPGVSCAGAVGRLRLELESEDEAYRTAEAQPHAVRLVGPAEQPAAAAEGRGYEALDGKSLAYFLVGCYATLPHEHRRVLQSGAAGGADACHQPCVSEGYDFFMLGSGACYCVSAAVVDREVPADDLPTRACHGAGVRTYSLYRSLSLGALVDADADMLAQADRPRALARQGAVGAAPVALLVAAVLGVLVALVQHGRGRRACGEGSRGQGPSSTSGNELL